MAIYIYSTVSPSVCYIADESSSRSTDAIIIVVALAIRQSPVILAQHCSLYACRSDAHFTRQRMCVRTANAPWWVAQMMDASVSGRAYGLVWSMAGPSKTSSNGWGLLAFFLTLSLVMKTKSSLLVCIKSSVLSYQAGELCFPLSFCTKNKRSSGNSLCVSLCHNNITPASWIVRKIFMCEITILFSI